MCRKSCTGRKVAVILRRYSRKVAWMSGLVTGLQNRAQRFESASDLKQENRQPHGWRFFVLFPNVIPVVMPKSLSDALTVRIVVCLA